MPSPRCSTCLDRVRVCVRCGGTEGAPLTGPAASRGHRWANEVVRDLVARWPSWPMTGPKALELADRRVADLHRDADDLRVYLIRVCLDAARRRYMELKEFLEEKRGAPPR